MQYQAVQHPCMPLGGRTNGALSAKIIDNVVPNKLDLNSAAVATDVDAVSEAHGEAPVLPYRVGHGFDLHRLEPGFPLIIGGVNIPHERGCDAHSDGAVGGRIVLLFRRLTASAQVTCCCTALSTPSWVR